MGLLLGVISLCMFGFDHNKISAAITQAKFYGDAARTETVALADKTSVSINVDNQSVYVSKIADDEFKLSWWEHSKHTITTFEPDGESGTQLSLKLREKFTFRMSLWTSSKYEKVTIEIPEAFDGEVKIIAHNGKVDIGGIDVDKIFVECYNGNTNINNNAANVVGVKNHNGKTAVNNSSIKLINIENNNGKVELDNVIVKTLDIRCHNGNIEVKGTTATDVKAVNHNGTNNITLRGKVTDYHITLKNSNGNSYLNGNKASGIVSQGITGTIELTTYNGANRLNFVA